MTVRQHFSATSVQRPKHVIRVGKTPALSDEQARQLLELISIDRLAELRDRALNHTMLDTFDRGGAVIAVDVEAYPLITSACSFSTKREARYTRCQHTTRSSNTSGSPWTPRDSRTD